MPIDSVPMLVGAMRFGAYMIAIANDDSLANAVLVRPNSPILKAKGVNKDFPETYGSAETVKGKTVLVTTVSSGHYALSTWLKRIGLKDTDTLCVRNIRDLPQNTPTLCASGRPLEEGHPGCLQDA